MGIKTRKERKYKINSKPCLNKKTGMKYKISKNGRFKKKKSKKRKTRKLFTINDKAGERRTRSMTAAAAAEVEKEKKCIHSLFVALGELAASKEKVDYLLREITSAGRNALEQSGPMNFPMDIYMWNSLFAANKFRTEQTDALKAELLNPNMYGSIAQLSQEAKFAVLRTGKSLVNKLPGRSSAKNIIIELDRVFRNNVDHAFINIKQIGDGTLHADLDGKLVQNIWKPEADLLFSFHPRDGPHSVYNFDNIEESKILQEKPIRVKLNFGKQSPQGPRATRVLLARIWNFFYGEERLADVLRDGDDAVQALLDAYFSKKLSVLCDEPVGAAAAVPSAEAAVAEAQQQMAALLAGLSDIGWDLPAAQAAAVAAAAQVAPKQNAIVDIINRLAAVNEERFTALIPYLPAHMFKDTPDGGPDYDVVVQRFPLRLEEDTVGSGFREYLTGLTLEQQEQVRSIYPRLVDIFNELAIREIRPDEAAAAVADANSKFGDIFVEMQGAGTLNLLKDLLVVMRNDILPGDGDHESYRRIISEYISDVELFQGTMARLMEQREALPRAAHPPPTAVGDGEEVEVDPYSEV